MDNPVNLMLIGASGKLGSAIESVLHEYPTLHLASRVTKQSPKLDPLDKIDVVLDVSTPEILKHNLEILLAAKKPLIIGSTGHSKEIIDTLKAASSHMPILMCANFAPGVNIMKQLLRHLPPNMPVKICETHHIEKKDAPSGTAKELAAITSTPESAIEIKREEKATSEHKVILQLDDEIIKISHAAFSRTPFAKGALRAVRFLATKKKGFYTSPYDQDQKFVG